ncbi:MAG TPA: class I SAM-dependent methyltransferase [Chitinophagaceae bacterium]|nr:class I SAM-dependent methyltransferase [Chitinophagaceae bacterium]
MKNTLDNPTHQQEIWFKTWFDSAHYHKLYQNRDDREASAFIDALLRHLQPLPGSHMLDLACGNGRHSKYLTQKGFNVTGLDLALSSISEAKIFETPALAFRQHDMRHPFGSNQYHYIFNFFTSFGYFKDESENYTVVQNIGRALKPNGFVLFDYLNVGYAEENSVPVEEKEIDGTVYHINRWSTDSFLYKRISIHEEGKSRPLEYIEKVARFTAADFERFFKFQGLQTVQLFGDYALNPYQPLRSKRLIILAQKHKNGTI